MYKRNYKQKIGFYLNFIGFCIFLNFCFGLAYAQEKLDESRIYSVPKFDELLKEIYEEGIISAQQIQKDSGNDEMSKVWIKKIQKIYSIESMKKFFLSELSKINLSQENKEAIKFYESVLGQKIVNSELDSRKILRDENKKLEAGKRIRQLKYFKPARYKLYSDIIISNNFIEENVASAMNSNLAFYLGYAQSKPSDSKQFLEAEMISQIWHNESETRTRMTDWVFNFSAISFEKFSDNELELYLKFSNSSAARLFNSYINYSFDKLFESQSFKLGQALGEISQESGT